MTIKEFFSIHPKSVIAFSGGVDSAYLLYAAGRYAAEVKAYYVKSAFQPQFELEDARRLAEDIGVSMEVLPVDVLADPQVKANPANRCYYCKKRIFTTIAAKARADGFTILLDGTNASDDADDRPGMKALRELSVFSPLRMCGLTKDRIRSLSRKAGLFTWNKPSYACLATRIPTGQIITDRLLARTEEAEDYMFLLGFSDFRVRTRGEMALIQVCPDQLPLLLDKREEILGKLGEMYEAVSLDLKLR